MQCRCCVPPPLQTGACLWDCPGFQRSMYASKKNLLDLHRAVEKATGPCFRILQCWSWHPLVEKVNFLIGRGGAAHQDAGLELRLHLSSDSRFI